MKRFYKINTALAATLFVLSLLTGCFFGNSSDSNSGNNGASGSGTKGTSVELQGRFTLPADFSTASRSATATLPTGWTYFVSAETTDGSLTATGTVNASAKTFTINLKTGYTWTILVGIKDTAANILLSDSFEKELTSTDTFLNHNFNLVPHKGGSGSVELSIFCDSTYTVTVESSPSAIFEILGSGAEKKLTATNIPSGIYSILLKFTKSGEGFIFTTTQTINVFDHLTTNKWHSGGNALIDSTGKFELTDQLFNLAKENKTEFYVDNHDSVGDDTYSGNYTAPLATIKQALSLIHALGSNDKTYTIHVKDSAVSEYTPGNISISKNIIIECYKTSPGDKLGRVTITRNTGNGNNIFEVESNKTFSISGLNFNGKNIAGEGNGTAITVNASATLTIYSGKIEGFDTALDVSGTLNLYGGEITENHFGLSNSAQTINLKGSPKIYNNTNSGIPHNLGLNTSSPKLQITGPLSADADIHISGLTLPSGTTSYAFTEGFTTNSPGVYAQQVFTSDTSGCAVTKLTSGTYAGEAAIALNGGSIALEDIKENISIQIDKTLISETPSENVFTFTVIKDAGLATEAEITDDTSLSYSYQVINRGTLVPTTDNKYYSTNRNVLTFTSSLPLDAYNINLTVTKDGRIYQGYFPLEYFLPVSSLSAAPTSGTYTLGTIEELGQLKDWVANRNTLKGVTFKLRQDIDTNDEEYTIGRFDYTDNNKRAFNGIFDGCGHTIKNKITSTNSPRIALFPYIKDTSAVIKNLTVEGTSSRGSIVGYLDGGTVEDCISKTQINVTDCSTQHFGGIVQYLEKGNVINCINVGTIHTSSTNTVGGIVGESNTVYDVLIENCINKGNITTYGDAGGIIGRVAAQNAKIINCKNVGNVTSDSSGGIFGSITPSSNCSNNCNFGTIINSNSNNSSGGICHTSEDLAFTMSNNCNSGPSNYGAIAEFFTSSVASPTGTNNYCINTFTQAACVNKYGQSSSSMHLIPDTNLSEISNAIHSFTLDDVDTVVASLNSWAQANSTDTIQYAGWKKNANNLPELDLGELDTLADSL